MAPVPAAAAESIRTAAGKIRNEGKEKEKQRQGGIQEAKYNEDKREITEQFLKSGDCFLNIHAGKDTKRYLSKKIRRIGLFSASVMSICLGTPLMLQYMGNLDSTLVMLPASVMLLTGMWCNLYQEYQAIKSFESYEMFI